MKMLVSFSCVVLISILLIKIIFQKHNKKNKKEIINEWIVPKKEMNTENLEKILNLSPAELRYNFRKIFNKRKIYKYNDNYLPYKKIDKSLSYKENGKKIFESTGMLNFTMLDYYYNNTKIDT